MTHSFKIPVIVFLLISSTLSLTSCKKKPTPPVVTTANVSGITLTTATTGGNVTGDGGAEVTARGVCLNAVANPTVANNKTSDGAGIGPFTSNLTQLTPGANYYVRAYATNSEGTAYGNQLSFTSNQIKDYNMIDVHNETNWDYWVIGKEGESFLIKLQDSIPSIIFFKPLPNKDGYPIFLDNHGLPSKAMIEDHIFLFGNFRKSLIDIAVVLPDGEIKVYRDIKTDYDLTIGLSKTQNNLQSLSSILKLASGIVGTVSCGVGLAAAIPTGGLSLTLAALGCGVGIVGLAADLFPESKVAKWTGFSSSEIGSVLDIVGCAEGNVVDCGLGITSAALTVTTNAVDDSEKRKDQIDVATGQLKTNLIVSTSQVTEFSDNSATLGGKVTPEGVALVTERGVFYGTSQNPESTGTKLQIGSGIGSFSINFIGLYPKTLYYVRAYAINSLGIAYGQTVSFTTLGTPTIPTATTTPISSITQTTANSGGNVTSSGGSDVIVRGVCWSTLQNPTTANSHTFDGTGTGTFTSSLTNLTANTTYYVKAYATNSAGTAYGSQVSFTTLPTSNTILNESFESYASGSFPNSWVADGNGTTISENYIDNSISYSGSKSLRLFGTVGGCWAAIAYHTLDVTPAFDIELAIRNGNEILSGCNPNRALVGLREGTTWTNPSRTFINFDNDGKIYGGGGIELGPYSNNTWYLVRIKYEIISTAEIKLSYWINNNYLGDESLSAISDENLLNNLEISVLEGSAWFDDIKILK